MNGVKAWIRLLDTPGIGAVTANRLCERLGHPANFVGRGMSPLAGVEDITPDAAESLARDKDPEDWKQIAGILEKNDIRFVSFLEEEYPYLLKAIYGAPPFLFYRGTIDNKDMHRSIAIVGTRKPTNYGRDMTRKIGNALAAAGVTIVSGLAHGIDTISHKSAIEAGARTYAVLGTPPEMIYPYENRELAFEITKHGALISENIPGRATGRESFPNRNRIISGMTRGTVVIEGAANSGSLITAKYALSQNRDIYALPGDVNRPQSEGPNTLIRDGARLISDATDILEDFGLRGDENEQLCIFPDLSPEEEKLYRLLAENRPDMSFDDLYLKAGLSFADLMSLLLQLDMKNVIRRLPGNRIGAAY